MTKIKFSTMKGCCPKCGPNINAEILAAHHAETDDKESDVWVTADYAILRCCGCECVYFRQATTFSEDWENDIDPATGEPIITLLEKISYWPVQPSPIRQSPKWMFDLKFGPNGERMFDLEFGPNGELASLLEELYAAVNHDLWVLAAIGVRTVFDRVADILGVDSALSFEKKLKELQANGKIGNDEKEILQILTDAGSAAAHRGWKPKTTELNALIDALETFLHRNLILNRTMRQIKPVVPRRSTPGKFG